MTTPRGIIGVIHLPAMPGDPHHDGDGGFDDVLAFALQDAEALVEGGVDGLIVENFGSAPFPKGCEGDRLPPHQVAFLTRVVTECRARFDVAVGVNCLRNDAPAAIGIAAASGADFIRVNVHTGAYVTDQGVIEGEAYRTLRYRKALDAVDVAILADVLVKHAAPLADIEAEDATKDCVQRGLADAVIVTGQATGAPVTPEFVERVCDAAGGVPVLVGSGLSPDNAAELLALCDGAIVGTYFKEGGEVHNPVDVDRVRRLVGLVRQ
jgi:hypothetical protein